MLRAIGSKNLVCRWYIDYSAHYSCKNKNLELFIHFYGEYLLMIKKPIEYLLFTLGLDPTEKNISMLFNIWNNTVIHLSLKSWFLLSHNWALSVCYGANWQVKDKTSQIQVLNQVSMNLWSLPISFLNK